MTHAVLSNLLSTLSWIPLRFPCSCITQWPSPVLGAGIGEKTQLTVNINCWQEYLLAPALVLCDRVTAVVDKGKATAWPFMFTFEMNVGVAAASHHSSHFGTKQGWGSHSDGTECSGIKGFDSTCVRRFAPKSRFALTLLNIAQERKKNDGISSVLVMLSTYT